MLISLDIVRFDSSLIVAGVVIVFVAVFQHILIILSNNVSSFTVVSVDKNTILNISSLSNTETNFDIFDIITNIFPDDLSEFLDMFVIFSGACLRLELRVIVLAFTLIPIFDNHVCVHHVPKILIG
jgi:hypothetical protein